ncbi:MAG TPA: DinB family protein [Longimicrobium sp.]|jgi:hypothetical protein|uniref:DinB family protein n=1 Tax=Longimicrobium sp. TaxID=2029185 RepID=UPI002EDB5FDD
MFTTQRELHERLTADMAANHERIATLCRPLDARQLERRPAEGSWNVGEVLEHLLVANELFLAPVAALVQAAPRDPAAPSRPWRPTRLGAFFLRTVERPKPLAAPKALRPQTPRPDVLESYLAFDARFAAVLADAADRDWNKLRFAPPLARWVPLRFNVGDGFRFHAGHVRRHLAQVERAVAHL